MASFDRGTKRQCLNCGTRFYDLNRDPILCPSCGKQFMLDTERPARAREKEEEEEVETEEIEVAAPADTVAPEVISLEDAEEAEDTAGEDEIPDVEDVEVEDDIGDDEDVFLEEDDEDGDKLDFDVSQDDEEH